MRGWAKTASKETSRLDSRLKRSRTAPLPLGGVESVNVLAIERKSKHPERLAQPHLSARGSMAVAIRRNLGNVSASDFGAVVLENMHGHQPTRRPRVLHQRPPPRPETSLCWVNGEGGRDRYTSAPNSFGEQGNPKTHPMKLILGCIIA